ncbi:methyltransferase [Luteolibacter arcticus]|uniref:Methyltransferase n=1 Tax=Luteolibacter arcticus TaxID=1581411 RepID=A0ABT3GJM2_9BACT|nr:methyltransferase [Luteolibacter arcticus]MCW1923686.1 methyltransferase [Luteolibacter arcticus]
MNQGSSTFDQYFTPESLICRLIEEVPLKKVKRIADFAVGKGALLLEAKKIWPEAELLGIDRDPKMVCSLKTNPTSGTWICENFLEWAPKQDGAAKAAYQSDLILLNPPFSLKAHPCLSIPFQGAVYRCSIALAFISYALRFLRKGGAILAILPHGVVHSKRDAALWSAIGKTFDLDILEDHVAERFHGCQVRCITVKIFNRRPKIHAKTAKPLEVVPDASAALQLSRGCFDHVSYKNADCRGRRGHLLIHTTNLKDGKIVGRFARLSAALPYKEYEGSLIVFPRVGRPSKEKVVFIADAKGLQFTSCVMVVACGEMSTAQAVFSAISEAWNSFRNCYGGTGAQYTTLEKVKDFIRSLPEAEGVEESSLKRSCSLAGG